MNDDLEPAPEALQLQLAGFEGPLDLLLDLARRQRVDLTTISILTLVDQYVAAVAIPARVNFRRAADWLVMAAWLTWLKSRLLIPRDMDEGGEAEQAAGLLADRLAGLEQVRTVTAWLEARPQLGRDMFESRQSATVAGPTVAADFLSLFETTLDVLRGRDAQPTHAYRPQTSNLWSVFQALVRTSSMIAIHPEGGDLLGFVPLIIADAPDRAFRLKAATSSTMAAVLELAKDGQVDLRQDEPFGRILVRAAASIG